jgi:RimJ/RimL family protein N-acetyltransferase
MAKTYHMPRLDIAADDSLLFRNGNSMNWFEPVTLQGRFVRLEPLDESHAERLLPHLDVRAFEFMHGREKPMDLNSLKAHFASYNARTTRLNWAVCWLENNSVAGRISFSQVQPPHWVEIGTMLMPVFWGGKANLESKCLLMTHAFESLRTPRVQFSVDTTNPRSQRAMEKLGAVKEGVLRNHITYPDGYVRSSVLYSVLLEEWAAVKVRLETKLEAVT